MFGFKVICWALLFIFSVTSFGFELVLMKNTKHKLIISYLKYLIFLFVNKTGI
jgi:hypothetical protein